MFEGAGTYLGFGYELEREIPGPISSYMEFQSESINPKWNLRTNPNINARKARQKGRLTSVGVRGGVKGAPDSESQAKLRAHHQGKVVTTVLDAPNTVYQHVMTNLLNGDAEPATYRRSLNGVVYRNDGAPIMSMGGVVDAVTIGIRNSEFVEMTHELMFTRVTRSKQPVAGGANNVAFTGIMAARGLRSDPADVANSIFVRVTTAGALDGSLPVPKVKVLKAATGSTPLVGAYTGLEYPVVHKAWTDAFIRVGAIEVPVGPSYQNPFQFIFRTMTPADVLTVGDVWEIAPRIPILSSPPVTSRAIYDAGQAVGIINGKQYVLHDATLKGTRPRVEDRGIGSPYVQQVLDNGEITWDIDLNRAYTDLDFVNAIEAGATASFLLTLTGDRIGASQYRDSVSWYLPATEFDDAGTNVQNANQEQEKVSLKAFDNKVDPICTETHVNTIPAL